MSQVPTDPKPLLTLSPEDAAALDALLDPASPGTQDSEPRTKNLQSWLTILSAAPVPQPSPDLVDRTLAAVQSERMNLSNATANQKSEIKSQKSPSIFRRHFADIAAMLVAACILVAVIIPAVNHARYSYRRTLCAANVSTFANAIDHYVTDNGGQLPSLANPMNANWLHPDAGGHTNTANLLPLLLADTAVPATPAYLAPKNFICPGRDLAETTAITPTASDIPNSDYSYVNLFGAIRPRWDGKVTTLILADRNPLFTRDPVTNPNFNSPNHQHNGNYILHADHSVTWEITPNIGPNHDNIWTIASNAAGTQRLLTYIGTETPASSSDVFLAP